MYNIHVNVWVDRFMVYNFVLVRGLDLKNLSHSLVLSMLGMDCSGCSNKKFQANIYDYLVQTVYH